MEAYKQDAVNTIAYNLKVVIYNRKMFMKLVHAVVVVIAVVTVILNDRDKRSSLFLPKDS
jgi:hypothetical protein